MAAKKKTEAPKAATQEIPESAKATIPEPAATEETVIEPASLQSDHFAMLFDRARGSVSIAPVGWVGPGGLSTRIDRLEELRDLLNQAL